MGLAWQRPAPQKTRGAIRETLRMVLNSRRFLPACAPPPMKLWEGDAGLLRVLLLCVWLETATGCVYRCGAGQ